MRRGKTSPLAPCTSLKASTYLRAVVKQVNSSKASKACGVARPVLWLHARRIQASTYLRAVVKQVKQVKHVARPVLWLHARRIQAETPPERAVLRVQVLIACIRVSALASKQ